MQKNLFNILYNPGSINTCGDGVRVPDYQPDHEELAAQDQILLKQLEEVVLANTEVHIEQQLRALYRQMIVGMSSGLRLVVLREFNKFIQRTTLKHERAKPLFHLCLQIIIEFKNQINGQNPSHGFIGKNEWVELERSLFFLAQWESKLGIQMEEMVLGAG